MENKPLTIERTLNAPPDKVWEVITSNDHLRKWYFQLNEFRAEPGFEFEFEGGPDDRKYLHKCRVTDVVPGKKLQYSWRYEGYEGVSYVTFELTPEGNKTRLILTHTGLETFPASQPDFARKNFEAGWTEIIGKLLKEYVDKLTN